MPSLTLRALVTVALCVLVAGRALPAQLPAQGASRAPTLAARLGHPADAKLLILHADDLGAAHSVNAASLEALERGIISSASVMMPTPWVTEVAAWARAHPDHDLGLHLTLTSEWETYRWGTVAPATEVPTLLDSVGTLARDETPVATRASVAHVERELRAQIERALAMGIRPTHLDTHMRVLFATPELYATYVAVARAYRLPFMAPREADGSLPPGVDPARDVVLDAIVSATPDVPPAQWKTFYLDAIRALRPGLTLMIVHLGRDDAELRAVMVGHEAWGAAWRQRDTDVLASPEFRQALKDHGVVVVRWKDVHRVAGGR